VFERFFRAQGVRGRTNEGTGIGLALVQELVWLHGGKVGVTSTLGAGSTFTVTIPTGNAHLPANRVVRRAYLDAGRVQKVGADDALELTEETLRPAPVAPTAPGVPARPAAVDTASERRLRDAWVQADDMVEQAEQADTESVGPTGAAGPEAQTRRATI